MASVNNESREDITGRLTSLDGRPNPGDQGRGRIALKRQTRESLPLENIREGISGRQDLNTGRDNGTTDRVGVDNRLRSPKSSVPPAKRSRARARSLTPTVCLSGAASRVGRSPERSPAVERVVGGNRGRQLGRKRGRAQSETCASRRGSAEDNPPRCLSPEHAAETASLTCRLIGLLGILREAVSDKCACSALVRKKKPLPQTETKKGPPTVKVDLADAGAERPLVRDCVRGLGWESSVSYAREGDIRWLGTAASDKEHQVWVSSGVVVNRFPGLHDLMRKRCFARILSSMQELQPDEFSFFPVTWVLPEDRAAVEIVLRTHRTSPYGFPPFAPTRVPPREPHLGYVARPTLEAEELAIRELSKPQESPSYYHVLSGSVDPGMRPSMFGLHRSVTQVKQVRENGQEPVGQKEAMEWAKKEAAARRPEREAGLNIGKTPEVNRGGVEPNARQPCAGARAETVKSETAGKGWLWGIGGLSAMQMCVRQALRRESKWKTFLFQPQGDDRKTGQHSTRNEEESKLPSTRNNQERELLSTRADEGGERLLKRNDRGSELLSTGNDKEDQLLSTGNDEDSKQLSTGNDAECEQLLKNDEESVQRLTRNGEGELLSTANDEGGKLHMSETDEESEQHLTGSDEERELTSSGDEESKALLSGEEESETLSTGNDEESEELLTGEDEETERYLTGNYKGSKGLLTRDDENEDCELASQEDGAGDPELPDVEKFSSAPSTPKKLMKPSTQVALPPEPTRFAAPSTKSFFGSWWPFKQDSLRFPFGRTVGSPAALNLPPERRPLLRPRTSPLLALFPFPNWSSAKGRRDDSEEGEREGGQRQRKQQQRIKKDVFIMKPDCGAQGIGVRLVISGDTPPEEILDGKDGYIVQQYIADPYLLDGKKFDLRIYALLLNVAPEPQVFISRRGLVRFCTEDYERPSGDNLDNAFMHLTNYAINKESRFFRRSDNVHARDSSKRLLEDVFEQLMKNGVAVGKVWKQVVAIVQRTMAALMPLLHLRYRGVYNCEVSRCFQIIGFDILLDKNSKAWLLEVNANPSLRSNYDTLETVNGCWGTRESQLDRHIKEPLVREALVLVYFSMVAPRLALNTYSDCGCRRALRSSIQQQVQHQREEEKKRRTVRRRSCSPTQICRANREQHPTSPQYVSLNCRRLLEQRPGPRVCRRSLSQGQQGILCSSPITWDKNKKQRPESRNAGSSETAKQPGAAAGAGAAGAGPAAAAARPAESVSTASASKPAFAFPSDWRSAIGSWITAAARSRSAAPPPAYATLQQRRDVFTPRDASEQMQTLESLTANVDITSKQGAEHHFASPTPAGTPTAARVTTTPTKRGGNLRGRAAVRQAADEERQTGKARTCRSNTPERRRIYRKQEEPRQQQTLPQETVVEKHSSVETPRSVARHAGSSERKTTLLSLCQDSPGATTATTPCIEQRKMAIVPRLSSETSSPCKVRRQDSPASPIGSPYVAKKRKSRVPRQASPDPAPMYQMMTCCGPIIAMSPVRPPATAAAQEVANKPEPPTSESVAAGDVDMHAEVCVSPPKEDLLAALNSSGVNCETASSQGRFPFERRAASNCRSRNDISSVCGVASDTCVDGWLWKDPQRTGAFGPLGRTRSPYNWADVEVPPLSSGEIDEETIATMRLSQREESLPSRRSAPWQANKRSCSSPPVRAAETREEDDAYYYKRTVFPWQEEPRNKPPKVWPEAGQLGKSLVAAVAASAQAAAGVFTRNVTSHYCVWKPVTVLAPLRQKVSDQYRCVERRMRLSAPLLLERCRRLFERVTCFPRQHTVQLKDWLALCKQSRLEELIPRLWITAAADERDAPIVSDGRGSELRVAGRTCRRFAQRPLNSQDLVLVYMRQLKEEVRTEAGVGSYNTPGLSFWFFWELLCCMSSLTDLLIVRHRQLSASQNCLRRLVEMAQDEPVTGTQTASGSRIPCGGAGNPVREGRNPQETGDNPERSLGGEEVQSAETNGTSALPCSYGVNNTHGAVLGTDSRSPDNNSQMERILPGQRSKVQSEGSPEGKNEREGACASGKWNRFWNCIPHILRRGTSPVVCPLWFIKQTPNIPRGDDQNTPFNTFLVSETRFPPRDTNTDLILREDDQVFVSWLPDIRKGYNLMTAEQRTVALDNLLSFFGV